MFTDMEKKYVRVSLRMLMQSLARQGARAHSPLLEDAISKEMAAVEIIVKKLELVK